jgi:hypothetical protein
MKTLSKLGALTVHAYVLHSRTVQQFRDLRVFIFFSKYLFLNTWLEDQGH